MITGLLVAAFVVLLLNLLRLRRRRGKRAKLVLPAMVYDSGVRSAWRTPGRRGPHRGY